MKPKAIIVSGYFNPLHKGHLDLFEKAKGSGDQLWVIVNSDLQRKLKGSKEFMDENAMKEMLKNLPKKKLKGDEHEKDGGLLCPNNDAFQIKQEFVNYLDEIFDTFRPKRTKKNDE